MNRDVFMVRIGPTRTQEGVF